MEEDCQYCVPGPGGHADTCPKAGMTKTVQELRDRFILHYVPHYLYKQPNGNFERLQRPDMIRDLDLLIQAARNG